MSRQNFIEIVSVIFAAGESREWHLSGAYFEIIDAPYAVDVVLTDTNGAQRGRMIAAEASFNLKNTEFNTVQLTSATAQTVRFAYGSGEAGTRRASGAVSITGAIALDAATLAALENTTVTVTNAVALDAATLAALESTTVTVAGQQGAFTQAAATVTSASGQLLAANAARRYLLVQNNDAAGVVYINLAGAAATVAAGIKIEAGGSYECAGYCPTGAIYAIGSIASNANVVIAEG